MVFDDNYRFRLQPGGKSKKKRCPHCERNSFTRYIDTKTGEYLADDVGKCDHLNSCGYHKTPSEFFRENPDKRPKEDRPMTEQRYYSRSIRSRDADKLREHLLSEQRKAAEKIDEIKKLSKGMIPDRWVTGAEKRKEKNILLGHLREIFGDEADKSWERYRVGTTTQGECIFWQIDENNIIHAGKIMAYGQDGHRLQSENGSQVSWIHSRTNIPGYKLTHSLFGGHLLNEYPDRIVVIVESEKTAIMLDAYDRCSGNSEALYVAVGGCGNFSTSSESMVLLSPLKERQIALMPDCGKENEWADTAEKLTDYLGSTPEVWFSKDDFTDEQYAAGADYADLIEEEMKKPRQKNDEATTEKMISNDFDSEGNVSHRGFDQTSPTNTTKVRKLSDIEILLTVIFEFEREFSAVDLKQNGGKPEKFLRQDINHLNPEIEIKSKEMDDLLWKMQIEGSLVKDITTGLFYPKDDYLKMTKLPFPPKADGVTLKDLPF